MRLVRFGKLSKDDWFVFDGKPYRSGELIFRGVAYGDQLESLIPCVNLLTSKIENFRLGDVVLILDKEDFDKLEVGSVKKNELS